MFLGERRQLVEDLVLATTDEARQQALDALEPLQKADFIGIFQAMDGAPVTIRLIDPPLHEFLPDIVDLSIKAATDTATAKDRRLLAAVKRLHEQNPMLGLRGVRLGLVIPGLFAMQVRAIAQAAKEVPGARPEIMIPLVAAVQELEAVREEAVRILTEAACAGPGRHHDRGPQGGAHRGPDRGGGRVLLLRHQRPDPDGVGLLPRRRRVGLLLPLPRPRHLRRLPFESLDEEGVGRLVRIAAEEGRAARPDLHLGICGEHGGDPASIHFCHDVGLDYVSCSPFRIPVARLEAYRAALTDTDSDTR